MTEGKCIYFGPAKRVLHYLERLGYPCPEHYNPADFYLDLMSVDFRTADLEVESRIRIDHLILEWSYNKEHFRNHDMQEQDMQMIIRPISMPIFQTVDRRGPSIQQPEESTLEQAPRDIRTVRKSCPEWIGDFIRLSWRASVEILRNYGSIAIKTATSLFFAVILSLVYHGIGFSQRNIQDRIGVLYFILVNQSFGPLVGMLNIFPAEKKIVNREIVSGAYLASSYYLSRVLAEIPLQTVNTVVYCSIIYWSIGLNRKPDRFLIFLVIVVLTALCSMSIGLSLSAFSPTAVVANALGPPFLIIFILFGGFYINVASLPPGSQWVINISFVYWGFQALAINEFVGETFECPPGDVTKCFTNGKEVLNNLTFAVRIE
eukprot:gene20148-20697_t